MKIIPKYQRGGGFESFFTTYTPIQIQTPNQTSSQQRSSGASQSSNNGELTEKDFFSMLKDIKGLPIDMQGIVSSLINTFQMKNLTGIDTGDLATMYLKNLYQIRLAQDNKEYFDKAIENAYKNGSMGEPAISMDGKLIVQDNTGKIKTIGLDTYFDNKDSYIPLTVSNLADMRKWDPQLAYNQAVFDVINNSMGYEEFQDLIEKAKTTLGSSKYSETSPAAEKALQGLTQIDNLSEEERRQLLQQVEDGTFKYSQESNIEQIQNLVKYITTAMPDRAKVWASLKLNNPDKQDSIERLVSTYLLGNLKTSITIQNTDSKTKSSSKSSSGSSGDTSLATNPNMGYWSQVVAGIGGEDTYYNIVSKDVGSIASGKYYGTTPGLDTYKSLSQYITDANNGYIIKNRDNITFGDNKLINGDDIVVDPNGGAYVVTLPINTDGQVNFSILEDYNRISDNVISQGYKVDTPEYKAALAWELEANGMGYLVEGSTLNQKMFGRFLVLQGVGSTKTQVLEGRKKVSLEDVDSQYVIDSSDDDTLYDVIQNALSTKDNKYELDNNIWNFGWTANDKVYRGNIFIPITTNINSAMNADNNDVRRAKAYEFEGDYQQNERRSKLNGLNSTSSDNL